MAKRPTYVSRFLESGETITKRMIGNIPDEYYKEPGDYIYDAMKTNPPEIIQLEENQDRILRNAFPQYCDDDVLDDHLEMRGVSRHGATYAIRELSVTADPGVRIPQGYTLTSVVLDGDGNPIQFSAQNELQFTEGADTLLLRAVCHIPGTAGNITTGAEFITQPPIPGIRRIVDNGIIVAGADRESADDYFTRYLDIISHPNTGGNMHDYVRWILDDFPKETNIIILKVKVTPRWNGRGTVKVVAIGADYGPLSDEAVATLQNWLDPGSEGQGYGKAPGGACVTVDKGTLLNLNITADVDFTQTADRTAIRQQFEQSVTEYIQSLVFETDSETKQPYPIAYAIVSSLLGTIPGVINFHNLTINGATDDIQPGIYDIPVLSGVVFSD